MARRRYIRLQNLLRRIPVGVFSAVVTLAILWLTLAPHPLPDNDLPMVPGLDKLVHACMFGGFYFALSLDAMLWRIGRGKPLLPYVPLRQALVFALAAIAFGGSIELVQGAMDMGRGCDVWDFCADSAGVCLSVWLSPLVLGRLDA